MARINIKLGYAITLASAQILSCSYSRVCQADIITATVTASTFLQSVGINMHSGVYPQNLSYNYTNPVLVENALNYLQIRHIRDALGAGFSKPGFDFTTVVEKKLAADGFKYDFSLNTVQSYELSALNTFASSYPGALESLEGPNECNYLTVAQALAFQQLLYTTVHTDSVLTNVPVMDFTLTYGTTTYFLKYGNLAPIADQGNVHIYGVNGSPPLAGGWNTSLSVAQAATPNRIMNVTETGYTSYPSYSWLGVDESTQAKYILDTLVDASKSNVNRTYLYELFDKTAPTVQTPYQGSFGMFRGDGMSPKPAGIAVHNLMTILGKGASGSAVPGQLNVSISNWSQTATKPAALNTLLIQKNAGTYDLVLWSEPGIWNSTTHASVPAITQNVTLSIPSAMTASVFDPMVDSKAVQVPQNPQNFTVYITDHPEIVEISVN